MHRRAADAWTGGFTLLELLVVMALLGILMGIGVGFLQRRGDSLDIAVATVRDQVRVAASTARSRHVPTEVRLDPGDPERPASVVASVPQAVGEWHMEANAALDDDGNLPSVVTGTVEPGRFGDARRADLSRQTSLLDVQTGTRPVADLRDGFELRVDVRLDALEAMSVARLGSSLELKLDEFLVPIARVVSTEGGERAGPVVNLHGARPLSAYAWHTLALVHDGRRVSLFVDEQEADSAPLQLPILQKEDDRFEVSPGDAPILGLVDEVLLVAYDRGEVQTLPPGVLFQDAPRVIAFDRNGDLVTSVSFRVTIGDAGRDIRIGPGGIVE